MSSAQRHTVQMAQATSAVLGACLLFAACASPPSVRSPEPAGGDVPKVRAEAAACLAAPNPVWVIPNTHGTATGWLTGFSPERNYMINNYETFLTASEQEDVPFVFSEVPTAIAMKELEPSVYERLKAENARGQVSVTNAFAVEYDASFVTAASNYRMGALAQDWFEAELGIRPAIAWNIDVLGVSPGFAENLDLLGVRLMVHERNAETRDPLYRLVAPSGASTLVASVKSYAQWRLAFKGTGPLPEAWKQQLLIDILPELERQPGLPFLWLVGASDYSRSAEDPARLREMLAAVTGATGRPACLGTSEDYQRSLKGVEASPEVTPVTTPGIYGYNAFWANLPQVKQAFRQLESRLAGAETAAAVRSLAPAFRYPAAELYEAWLLLLLNADRALLWGAGSDEPFTGETEWNVEDRAAAARQRIEKIEADLGGGHPFDPIGWDRTSAYVWNSAANRPQGAMCEQLPDESAAACQGGLRAFGGSKIVDQPAAAPEPQPFTGVIETASLRVEIDPVSGDLAKVTDKATGATIMAGGNEIIWTRDDWVREKELSPSDFLSPIGERVAVGSTAGLVATINQMTGPVYTTVEVASAAPGGMEIIRKIRIPHVGTRIEFITETEGISDGWLLSARFDLGQPVGRQLRGAAFGFDRDAPRAPRDPLTIRTSYDQDQLGFNETIGPAMRWSSHLPDTGAGFVLLDKGLLGREWGDAHADILLVNAQASYRGKTNELISGKPRLTFHYALMPAVTENAAVFARAGAEYTTEPLMTDRPQAGFRMSDSLVIESVSRKGKHLQILAQNMADEPVTAEMAIPWPHTNARIEGSGTEADGVLRASGKGAARTYTFTLAPRDAFLLIIETKDTAPAVSPVQTWATLLPQAKLGTLSFRDRSLVGHPPE